MFVNGCYRHHILVLTFYLLCMIYVQYVSCEQRETENRHLFPLLGYLHGYKIGQNIAYQLPPFVLSPVVILPSINQQQSVNVQKSTSGDNYYEHGGSFQIISPSKLILNFTEDYNDKDIEKPEIKQTTKIDTLQKSDLLAKYNQSCDHDTFRQVVTYDTGTTTVKTTEFNNEDEVPTSNMTNSEVESLKVTTQVYASYPTAVYTNKNISSISITTSSLREMSASTTSLQNNLTVTNTEDIQSMKENITGQKNITDNINLQSNGSLESSSTIRTTAVASEFRGYSYKNPWYSALDKLSITTSSYTNYESHLPLAYDDRWQSFSSSRKPYPTSDFRPLAGLYHDGFFHKYPLKKSGFIPLNSKYLYYN
ncbi:uncharacterized protein LOC112047342 [Bicyclus anynana]|uniref:Uncharacterized protein LOC112047342 n=1 Tax=Bicyclus anynana TaxID=110368 RepID=A0A6J1NAZ9_BICAN|nr:uncharacterized protein LOC112047342 [Bicyclus anynana]